MYFLSSYRNYLLNLAIFITKVGMGNGRFLITRTVEFPFYMFGPYG